MNQIRHSSIQGEKVTRTERKSYNDNYVFQILFHAISGRYAEDSGAVREFAIDNGSVA
jgi:hypothetical protein